MEEAPLRRGDQAGAAAEAGPLVEGAIAGDSPQVAAIVAGEAPAEAGKL